MNAHLRPLLWAALAFAGAALGAITPEAVRSTAPGLERHRGGAGVVDALAAPEPTRSYAEHHLLPGGPAVPAHGARQTTRDGTRPLDLPPGRLRSFRARSEHPDLRTTAQASRVRAVALQRLAYAAELASAHAGSTAFQSTTPPPFARA